jgi:hypothetical protein
MNGLGICAIEDGLIGSYSASALRLLPVPRV